MNDLSDYQPRALAKFFVSNMTVDRWSGVTVRDAYSDYSSRVRKAGGKPVSLRDFRRELVNAGWRWPKENGQKDVLRLVR